MRTDRIKALNNFIKKLTNKAQDKPDGYFTTHLNGLMWSLMSLEATFQSPIDIKAGLLQAVNEHTDVLLPPSKKYNQSTAGSISEPTRNRYIQMVKEDKGDYNKKTFDTILLTTVSAGFNRGFDFSGFWEGFAKDFMRFELYPMLPAKGVRSGTDPFWISKSKNRREIMVNLNVFNFCTIFGKALYQIGNAVFDTAGTSFDYKRHLMLLDMFIERTLSDSPFKLMSRMNGFIDSQ